VFDYQIALAGAVVGLVVGLTGMGGGALLTPILVLLFGIDPLTAVSSDLVAAVIMKPVGGAVHMRRGTVNMRLVKWLVAGSVPTAFASVVVLTHLTDPEMIDDVVSRMIGGALLLASMALVAKGAFAARKAEIEATAIAVHPTRTFAIGLFGGTMVGLTSVGSGSLMMVLLLMLYPRLTAKQLVGTDLVQAVPLVISAAAGHLLFGDVHLDLTGSLLVGAIPGVFIGAHVSSRAPDRLIRPILPIILVPSAMKMLGADVLSVGIVAGFMVALAVILAISQSRTPPPTAPQI
jgi:uncharacterized membrane protein YfcA